MSAPIAYGIDFGTTNTLLSVAREGGVDLLEVDGDSELLPSVTYFHRNAIRSAGRDAIRQYNFTAASRQRCGSCALVQRDRRGTFIGTRCHDYLAGSGCHDSRLISEIKRALADPDYDSTHSWARDFDTPEIVATIFKTLKRRADKAVRFDVKRAVIGHPVAFEGVQGSGFAQKQLLAKKRLRKAAERAGFTEVELLEEPAAAVSLEDDDGIVLAADFGGGTFDVSVIDISGTKGVVRALTGAPVGGEDFDGLLFQHALFPQLGLVNNDRHRVPNRYRQELGRRSSAVRSMADAELSKILSEIQREGRDQRGIARLRSLIDNGWVYELYSSVEQAKQRLSEVVTTRIRFERVGIEIDVEVSRNEFENWISGSLVKVRRALCEALSQAGIGVDQVDLVACTGGSSRIPAFQALLADLFGAERVTQRDPYSAIVLGLGLHARRLWRG